MSRAIYITQADTPESVAVKLFVMYSQEIKEDFNKGPGGLQAGVTEWALGGHGLTAHYLMSGSSASAAASAGKAR
jgi:hypothetical protein